MCAAAFAIDAASYEGPRANALGPVANTAYGARAVQGANVTMPNGNMDPWHALGVVNASDPFFEAPRADPQAAQRVAPGVSIVELDGTAHCRDMYAPGVFEAIGVPDTEPVKWAHAKIAANVAAYLE